MGKAKFIKVEEAVALVKDGMTIATEGFVGSALPEYVNSAIEKSFLETGSPKDLTLFHAAGIGSRDGSGADRFGHEGMLKRVIAGHYNLAPNIGQLIIDNKIEAYNLPQGTISHMFRDAAAGRVGTITHVGLGTFVDPRIDGGKISSKTTEDIVEIINIKGQDKILYNSPKIDVAVIRGTYADENGNVTMEHEVFSGEATSIAQATKNAGGIVIVQVKKAVANGSLDPKLVKIPGICVDYVVVCTDDTKHEQYKGTYWNPALSGQCRMPLGDIPAPKLDAKKIIGRRAAMELTEGSTVNLGIGAPEFISMVANEEGIGDYMTLTVESGPIGGVPQGGAGFGSAINPEAILDQGYQFDFYDGGGLDLAFLGLAQTDAAGNINVSKFGPRVAGCGGFINITQNSKKVFFCGTFTAGGLKTSIKDGKLVIDQEGKEVKFLKEVEHVTFSGKYAREIKQPVRYFTERAVFELREDGMYLIEVAPGIDTKTQILDLMEFEPKMDGEPKLMDARIFVDAPMGLKK
jgi:Acyl CoA:acetate/3-ketoacid CoA transferase